ncbi:MAG: hypothetical protein N2560_10445 [Ignavibacteria bacterium]|nr:hypothetical protein [Ignavibacteria bacterium]
MNNSKLFWGIFFISLGLFYIFDLIPYYTHPYHFNLKLFPLIFLFAGILLLKPKKAIATLSVVLLSILLSSITFSAYKFIKYENIYPWFQFLFFCD